MNVLVVEDDPRIADLLKCGLTELGHRVSIASRGSDAVDLFLNGQFDAGLLDVLLPGMDGLSVLARVRSRRCRTPIMMLTAVDTVPKIVDAFDLGADDYLIKPFHLDVLVARLGAISRRARTNDTEVLQVGNILMNAGSRSVTRSGRNIHLTRKQFDLLEVLLKRQGLVTTREDLIEAGWGYSAEIKNSTLDVYVHGLRVKLDGDSASSRVTIRTIHGLGYKLMVE